MDDMSQFLSLLGLLAWDHPGPTATLLVGAAGLIVGVTAVLCGVSWTVCRSHYKGEIGTLAGQIGVYQQRLELAKEKEQIANAAVDEARLRVAELKALPYGSSSQTFATTTNAALDALTTATNANNEVSVALQVTDPVAEKAIRDIIQKFQSTNALYPGGALGMAAPRGAGHSKPQNQK
jgi:hypothetical protein